jgi:hypothetical protein
MNLNIKAALLSALVLPGLGQIVNGKKVKGFALIIVVNIFILVALLFVLKGVGQLVITMKSGGSVDMATLLEQVRRNGGSGPRWLLNGFLGIWAYALLDALVDSRREEVAEEESP